MKSRSIPVDQALDIPSSVPASASTTRCRPTLQVIIVWRLHPALVRVIGCGLLERSTEVLLHGIWVVVHAGRVCLNRKVRSVGVVCGGTDVSVHEYPTCSRRLTIECGLSR